MKVCAKCKRKLPLDQFPTNKKSKCGVSSQCRDCRNEYYKKHYYDGKRVVDSHKTHCAKCGVDIPYVLTFHHVDYKTKCFDVSVARRKLSSVLEELEKCICLCHNCHHTYHYFYGLHPDNPGQTLVEFLSASWTPPVVKH